MITWKSYRWRCYKRPSKRCMRILKRSTIIYLVYTEKKGFLKLQLTWKPNNWRWHSYRRLKRCNWRIQKQIIIPIYLVYTEKKDLLNLQSRNSIFKRNYFYFTLLIRRIQPILKGTFKRTNKYTYKSDKWPSKVYDCFTQWQTIYEQ